MAPVAAKLGGSSAIILQSSGKVVRSATFSFARTISWIALALGKRAWESFWSGLLINVPEKASRADMKNLSGASLEFCQFPTQPPQFAKAAFEFVDVAEYQIAAVRAAHAAINVSEYIRNDRFFGAEQITYFVIAQPARDQEHRLEFHWCQQARQRALSGFVLGEVDGHADWSSG
jgi:hypothetical protein